MLTEKQQQIVDSLVSEFTKMNAPVNTGKKGLLDWDEIYSEKEEWEKTKREVGLKNQAMIDAAKIEVDRITELLHDEFYGHFYLHQSSKPSDIQYYWWWYLVPINRTYTDALARIELEYKKKDHRSKCGYHYVTELTSWQFEYDKLLYNTIEELFTNQKLINKIKSHINKSK